jgi:hypothetical protein
MLLPTTYIQRRRCTFKEMLVIPVDKVVDPKKNNWTKWRAEEEERGGGTRGR